MRFEHVFVPLLVVLPLAGCDRAKPKPRAAASPAVSVAAPAKVAKPVAKGDASGPRRLLWRQGKEHDYALALDREGLARLSDAERAAVAHLATTIGSNCEWDLQPEMARDGGVAEKGKMRCALTDALGLGEQCGEKHKAFVMGWLGDDAPSSCAKIPITAFSQATFDELSLSHDGDRIVVSYAAVHTDGPSGPTQSWSETIRFAPRGENALRIESRRVTKGKPPP